MLGEANILRRWIIWSTVLGCFSAGAALIFGTVHLLFFYPVILLNLFLLAFLRSLWFPPGLLLLLAFTAASGVVGMVQGTDTLGLFLKSEIGIVLSAIYACAFFRFMRFDTSRCFRLYAQAALYVAVLGLLIYPAMVAAEGWRYRLESIEYEPGEFCIVCLPALYYFGDRWNRYGESRGKFLLLLAAILLSQSSIGFLGMMLALYLFSTRYRVGTFVAPFCIVLLAVTVYAFSYDFQVRIDDTFTGLRLLDAASLNDSSFSLVSGAFVAAHAFLRHPVMGEGLGSISLVSSRYLGALRGIETVPDSVLSIAAGDGGSMLFRLAGETGLIGLMLVFGYLFYCFPRHATEDRKQISKAILVYVFVKMLRSGIYFNPEVLFLVMLYAVNGSHKFEAVRERLRAVSKRALDSSRLIPEQALP